MNEIEVLQGRLDELAKSLQPNHLKFAIGVAAGGTIEQAFIDAGFSARTARKNASAAYKKFHGIREYVLTAQLLASHRAQDSLEYDEKRWLKDMLEAVEMAMGRKEIATMFFGEEKNGRQTSLSAFAKLSEQLGKKLGIFKETINLNAAAIISSIPPDADPQKAAEMYQDMMRGS